MRIFLVGATGYVGSVVAEKLQAAGHSVFGLARNEAAANRLRERGIEAVEGDLRYPDKLARYVKEADGVIHSALAWDAGFTAALEFDRQLVRALVKMLAGSGKALIVSSGTGSLGDTGNEPAAETAPVNLAVAQAEADKLVIEGASEGVHSVVIRLPGFIYGRAGSVLTPLLINNALQNGVAYYVGDGEQKHSAVHVEDVARLYVLALEKAPAGSIYHASTQTYTTRTIAEAVGRLTGTPTASLPAQEAGRVLGDFAWLLPINNVVDPSKANGELGWQAAVTPSLLEDIEHGSYQTLLVT